VDRKAGGWGYATSQKRMQAPATRRNLDPATNGLDTRKGRWTMQ
jgi:hypothetical protein